MSTDEVCASCGISAVDDVNLEECDGCDLVKYCSDGCRELHRPEHGGECRKRKAEIHDKKLFSQPDGTYAGECPLCFVPMPLDPEKTAFHPCCSAYVCKGCVYANLVSNKHVVAKIRRCPFCREVASEEECKKMMMKRVKANDPAAMLQMGLECYGEGNYDGAFEYFTKAAELGDSDAYNRLGNMYDKGEGVEEDMSSTTKKAVYYWEKAAIGGHHIARFNLACYEQKNVNMERAVKHFIIAANLGDEVSMKHLWTHYSEGNITKEDLDATLRTHQTAIDAMKSAERDAAEAFFRKHNIY